MDIKSLTDALTITTNQEERLKNEELISHMKQKENYISALLNISCYVNTPVETQLNAAIQLKNFVLDNWKFGPDNKLNQQLRYDEDYPIIVISKQDKDYIRTNILDALVYSTTNIKLMKQFNQSIKKIIKLEFGTWKEFLMTKILEFFKSADDNKIFAGIIAFYQIAKIYEFESGSYKESYTQAYELVNDYFLGFLNGLILNINNKQASLIMYKILKIYFKSIQMDICPLLYNEQNFERWNFIIITCIRNNLDVDYIRKTDKTNEIEELNKTIFWKLKKLCYQTIYRIYQKYGLSENIATSTTNSSAEIKKRNLNNFAIIIENKYLAIYLDVCLQTLTLSKAQFTCDYILCLTYKFLSQMITRYHLIEAIDKHLEIILKDHIVQNAMVTMKDYEMWMEDPKSYINKQFEVTETYYVLRYSVCQFIKTLCSFKNKNKKGKPSGKCLYYDSCYKYLVSILELYEKEVLINPNTDFRIKESVMYILQALAPSIINKSKESVEQLIEVYIIKEFTSKFPFLRERACSFIECFRDYKYTNQNLLHEITKKICFILDQETDLPVKVMAAITAPELLKNQGIKDILMPHLPKLLEIYLNLINTIDLEEILDGLETIISKFNHQIKDYAVELTFELVKFFKKLIAAEESEDNDNKGENIMVIDGVVRTLLKILELFINDPEVYPRIESNIHEMISWALQVENFENLDNGLDFLSTILKKGKTLLPRTWDFYPQIIFSLIGTDEEVASFKAEYPNSEFEGMGYEQIQDIITIICYYIIRDPTTFLTGADKSNNPYLTKTIYLVQRIISLAKSKKSYTNIRYGLKILLVVIETCKSRIDNIVKEVLMFMIDEINISSDSKIYKLALIETIAACIFYDPILAIDTIQSKNMTEKLFEIWLILLPSIKLESELKRTLLAFTSIIISAHKNFINIIPSLIPHVIRIAGEMNMKRERRTNVKTADEPEDCLDDSQGEDREDMLNQLLAKAKNSTLNDCYPGNTDSNCPLEGDDDIDDELYEEEEEDEDWDTFSNEATIVDQLNEIIFIKEAFQSTLSNNPIYYEELMKLFDNEMKVKLETYIKNEEIRIEIASRK